MPIKSVRVFAVQIIEQGKRGFGRERVESSISLGSDRGAPSRCRAGAVRRRATAGLGYGRGDLAFVAVLAGILVYVLLPRPRLPQGAVHHERMPTVHMPDLLGFMLATTFFALPLIVSAQEPWLGGPWGLYLLTGLPGLIALLIFYIAIRHQCLWLQGRPGTT